MRRRTVSTRCNEDERKMIDYIAEQLQRTKSDAMRWLIRTYYTQLKEQRERGTRNWEVENRDIVDEQID